MINIPHDRIKSILVLNLGGIGDFFFSTPALRALRKFYPQSRISLLTIPRSGEIANSFQFDKQQLVDKVMVFRGLLDAMGSLRKDKYDLAINMRTLASMGGAFKMAFLFFLSGAKYKAGRDTQGRGFFLNIKLPEKDIAAMHDADYDLSLAGLLGGDTSDRTIALSVRPEDRIYIENFLSRHQVKKEDALIAINPTATWQSKNWGIDNFSQVINALTREHKYKIVITGSKDDRGLAERLKCLSGAEAIIAAAETNVGQLAALIERSNLFITNDGGAMHIGAILKRPMVAIFGPTDIVRFGLYEKYDKGIILHKKADCAPCFKKECESLKCLKSISPQEVIDAARGLLAQK